MKLAKATATLLLLVMGAMAVLSASAQQPMPSSQPTVHVPITLPISPPRGWDAKHWATVRQQCQTIANKSASHIGLTMGEYRQAEYCGTLYPPNPSVTHEPELPQGQIESSPRPTPMPSPQSLSAPATQPSSRLRTIRLWATIKLGLR